MDIFVPSRLWCFFCVNIFQATLLSISHYSDLVSWNLKRVEKWLYLLKYEELPQFLTPILYIIDILIPYSL